MTRRHPLAGGDALVYGEALSTPGSITRIRERMGVCPQTDILWAEMTGTEHLHLYGAMKVRYASWPACTDIQDAPLCSDMGLVHQL
jgi:ABC-type multidrug transport system ATPase subunit